MHVWIEPVLNDSLGMLSNLQLPNLIVELEDYQHVHGMPNLPLTCHPNEHTGKVTIGVKFGLHTAGLLTILGKSIGNTNTDAIS